MKQELWYAVSGTGQGCIFTCKPIRDTHRMIWLGDMESCLSMTVCRFEAMGMTLPDIGWKDEPVMIELSIDIKEAHA